eukprot:TRINITY_DN23051_c0_g2_i2.p2 TRINITY_DN23051_c0_g2~~TRINITY_DN23051_c0_g2_i2.p2  ORF type:complete len:128 (-),score=4.95 TRINITY_DN23051_c0_g2_i2:186-569(-)
MDPFPKANRKKTGRQADDQASKEAITPPSHTHTHTDVSIHRSIYPSIHPSRVGLDRACIVCYYRQAIPAKFLSRSHLISIKNSANCTSGIFRCLTAVAPIGITSDMSCSSLSVLARPSGTTLASSSC